MALHCGESLHLRRRCRDQPFVWIDEGFPQRRVGTGGWPLGYWGSPRQRTDWSTFYDNGSSYREFHSWNRTHLTSYIHSWWCYEIRCSCWRAFLRSQRCPQICPRLSIFSGPGRPINPLTKCLSWIAVSAFEQCQSRCSDRSYLKTRVCLQLNLWNLFSIEASSCAWSLPVALTQQGPSLSSRQNEWLGIWCIQWSIS